MKTWKTLILLTSLSLTLNIINKLFLIIHHLRTFVLFLFSKSLFVCFCFCYLRVVGYPCISDDLDRAEEARNYSSTWTTSLQPCSSRFCRKTSTWNRTFLKGKCCVHFYITHILRSLFLFLIKLAFHSPAWNISSMRK